MRATLTTLMALLVFGTTVAHAGDSGDPKAVALIRELEQQRIDAGLRKDVAALE